MRPPERRGGSSRRQPPSGQPHRRRPPQSRPAAAAHHWIALQDLGILALPMGEDCLVYGDHASPPRALWRELQPVVSVCLVRPRLLPLLATGSDPAARTFARPPEPPQQAERPPETSAGTLLVKGRELLHQSSISTSSRPRPAGEGVSRGDGTAASKRH